MAKQIFLNTWPLCFLGTGLYFNINNAKYFKAIKRKDLGPSPVLSPSSEACKNPLGFSPYYFRSSNFLDYVWLPLWGETPSRAFLK